MKKVMVVLIVMAVVGTMAWAAETAAKKGTEVTVSGTLSCASCKIAGHECPKGCCETCVKSGDPALLQDAKGDLFLMLSGDMGKSAMTPDRMSMLGEKVTVKGMLVKEHGLQGIYVAKMDKMAADAKPAEKKAEAKPAAKKAESKPAAKS